MKNLRTIILAAGKGSRMKSDTPKILHMICGKTIIEYVLELAKAIGSLKTFIVVGHQSDKVSDFLNGGETQVSLVKQKELLGTADAVKCASSVFDDLTGDVLILSGDAPLLRAATLKNLVKKHQKAGAACTFLTAVVQNNAGYGRVIRDGSGSVIAIREENDASHVERQITEINSGVYCFQSGRLANALKAIKINERKKEFYLTHIIEILAKENFKIETLVTADPTEGLGVNTREDLAFAGSVIRGRILKELMQEGVTIVDPNTTHISLGVKIGRDTVIHPFTVIDNNVRIGSNCAIGPFARLRSGTKIGNKVQIGNFTEVSRSTIGDETLVKHFSFLGDADIGDQVNIGAGVVTANFDGINKNQTKIGDQAFIGSDSVLIAPVRIGKKAVTGAGCVVTKGMRVSDGEIIVGVPGRIKK